MPAVPELTPAARRRLFGVAAVGSFVSSLSTSVVGVVMPRIGAWAGVDVLDVQWVMHVPLVVIVAMLLPAGRLGDLVGHRRVYLGGLAILVLGSVFSAASPSFFPFLAGRAVQGFGAAMLMASSPALVSLGAEPGRRGRALGLISTALYLGLMLGPVLGGLLESWAGFRAVFWMQAVLPGGLLLLAVPLLPEVGRRPQTGRTGGLDLPGVGLLACGLAIALLGASRWKAWGLPLSLGLLATGGLVLAAFVAWETRARSPVLDLSLFRDRTFASAAVGAFLNYLAIFHSSFLMPFHLVDDLGLAPSRAGLVLMAMPLLMALLAGPSGALSDRLGSRGLSSAGMAISSAALLGLAAAVTSMSLVPLVAATACLGVGTGLFVSPNTNALLSATPRERQGTASGLLGLARNLGMVSGTALSAATYALGGASVRAAGGPPLEASIHGLRLAFGLAALLAAVGALVVLVRPRAGQGQASTSSRS